MRGRPAHDRGMVQRLAAERTQPGSPWRSALLPVLALSALLLEGPQADSPSFHLAYIGPGAGFAFLGLFSVF